MNKEAINPRGKEITGTVVAARMSRTVTVEWQRQRYIPKFERYERRRSRVKAHNPEAMGAKQGDVVLIRETRPISKTKHFIVIKILKRGVE